MVKVNIAICFASLFFLSAMTEPLALWDSHDASGTTFDNDLPSPDFRYRHSTGLQVECERCNTRRVYMTGGSESLFAHVRHEPVSVVAASAGRQWSVDSNFPHPAHRSSNIRLQRKTGVPRAGSECKSTESQPHAHCRCFR